ncbi:radical SAM/SPASM domain-containing protein [Candidatus Latescibacterota bacterium]
MSTDILHKTNRLISLMIKGQFDVIVYKIGAKFNKQLVLPSFPDSLNIEPTNACNLKCPACKTGSGRLQRPNVMMSFDNYRKIIDDVRGYVNYIGLFFMGEPFLNKDILKMINYTSLAGIDVEVSTNAQFFTSQDFCLKVVKSGLNHCVISLDGADQETLSKYRVGADFNKIITGIKYLQNAKKELASKTPTIEIQFIVMKHNEYQRKIMKTLAESLGVEIFCEKTMAIPIDRFDGSGQQDFADMFLPENLDNSRYYKNNDGKYYLKGSIPNKCSRVYVSAVINAEGNVVPCCYDIDSEHIMGNIFEEPLKTIWKNKKFQKFRKQIKKDRASIPMCNKCSEGRYLHLNKNRI